MSFKLNRYQISEPINNELLLVQSRSKKLLPLTGLIIFGGMGALFAFLLVNSLLTGGYILGNIIILGVFAVFMLGLSVYIFLSNYVLKTSYHFTKEKLVIKSGLSRPKVILRNSVRRIFIQKVMYADTRTVVETDYFYAIMMKMKLSAKPKQLLVLENQDSLISIAGILDEKGMSKTVTDAHRLASIISEFWEVEVRAKQAEENSL
jgi:hypothetical protein